MFKDRLDFYIWNYLVVKIIFIFLSHCIFPDVDLSPIIVGSAIGAFLHTMIMKFYLKKVNNE